MRALLKVIAWLILRRAPSMTNSELLQVLTPGCRRVRRVLLMVRLRRLNLLRSPLSNVLFGLRRFS